MNPQALTSHALGLALAAVFVSVPSVQAEDSVHPGEQIAKKFVRGVANLSTGWMEFPRQVYTVGQTEGWITGVLEVATFPVPLPTHKPILSPAYAWESVASSEVMPTTSRETR